MKDSGPSGPSPVFVQLGKTRSGGVFSVILMLLAALAFLVFGVGLLMIIATVAVLLLPWLWWKKKQLLKKMQQMQQQIYGAGGAAQGNTGAHSAYRETREQGASGVIIEGEVIVKSESIDHKAS